MVKVLNREAIQRMNGRGAGSVGSGGSSEGGGGISIAQVDAAYVSKDFFNQLFTVHGKRTYTDPDTQEEVTEDVIISPNQIAEGEYSLSNVEVSVGLWTNSFLSALGLNSGGGGGGATALTDLVDVALSNPQNGQVLVYNSSTGKWVNGTVTPDLSDYATKAWVQQQGYITASAISDMATKTWVGQQGFLKASDLNGYATQQWVGQNYLGVNETAAAATKLQTARSIWGQLFDGTGNITGNMEDVGIILQNGQYTVMGRNEAHGALIESLTNTVTMGLHNGQGVSWDTRSGSGYMLQLVYDASNTVAKKYTRVYDGLRIGDGMLVWDGSNNALKAIKADGTSINFYATGGVSALGMSAGVSQVDAMTFNYVTINNNLEFGAASRITHAVTSDDRTLYIGNSDNSGWVALQDVCSQRGESYWKIMANGEALFAEKVQSPKFYLDSTRYLYINGGTLYYYNGSTSRQIAFA